MQNRRKSGTMNSSLVVSNGEHLGEDGVTDVELGDMAGQTAAQLLEKNETPDSESEESSDQIKPLRTTLEPLETESSFNTLNDEFAVPPSTMKTWRGELEGGLTQSLCVGIDDGDSMGCNQCTACVCGVCLKAERLGNMPVLYAHRRHGKPTQLVAILGPFWPCLVGVTYPLIIGVSLFSAVMLLPSCPVWVIVLWVICTATLLVSLTLTACTNPGVVRRWDEPPQSSVGWRWNDQVQSYRPPKATYDRDCGVVIEEFDHTCPWTVSFLGFGPWFCLALDCHVRVKLKF
jgi:hypothetical protein